MFEKILVCLDGSGAAERILSYITDDALRFHSKVILLRVVSPPETIIPVNIPGSPGVPVSTKGAIRHTIAEENEAETYLKRIAEPLRAKGLNVECVVLPGLAGETIMNYAQENDCKLITISTHGHGGLRRLALGSTADFVVHRSPLPVLTVRT